MDDATSRIYSGFFVEQEGTWSSFLGVRETIAAKGIFASLYTDRGSHYWYTPKAGGKVDKEQPTQFGRAMKELGIEMIPSYSPQARGRCERCFGTLQGRLPQELAREGIREMAAANEYLRGYWPRFNAVFGVRAEEAGGAFVPLLEVDLNEILCLKETRTVRNDNCVAYNGKVLQIRLSDTESTTCGHRSRCANTRMGAWPFSTTSSRWGVTIRTGGSRKPATGPGRPRRGGSRPSRRSGRDEKSGQTTCYQDRTCSFASNNPRSLARTTDKRHSFRHLGRRGQAL